MIEKFSCRNFKNVNIRDLSFNRINILIGLNNSGKTNFIRALSFCADMVNNSERLIGNSSFQTLVCRYGMGDIFNKYSSDERQEISLRWRIALDGKRDVDYRFCFRTGKQLQDFFITKERLDNSKKPQNKKNPFNYFTCQERAGEGYISRAVNTGENNERINDVFKYGKMNRILFLVDTKSLGEPYVPIVSDSQAKNTVEEIEARLSVCDSIESTVNNVLQELNAMRQSVLKEAFEGRL